MRSLAGRIFPRRVARRRPPQIFSSKCGLKNSGAGGRFTSVFFFFQNVGSEYFERFIKVALEDDVEFEGLENIINVIVCRNYVNGTVFFTDFVEIVNQCADTAAADEGHLVEIKDNVTVALIDDLLNLFIEYAGVFPVDASTGLDYLVFIDFGNGQFHAFPLVTG
jgi:hypothetical protein